MLQLIHIALLFFSPLLFAESLVDELGTSIANNEVLFPFLLSFSAGLLTSLSPCVYPLIPITLSVMGARRYQSHVQGFLVALFYVLGMSLLYAVLGVLFASLGMLLGSFMQHPVVLVMIAIFFAILALSMFGVFRLTLPEAFLNRLTSTGGQGFRGAFLMGLVAGLLAAPCTGPVIGFILTLVTNAENIFFGFVLMLSFSLGMGLPFLILGTFSSAIARLPKSGAWMDSIKYILGATIMGASLYYFALALPVVNELLTRLRAKGWFVAIFLLLVGIILILIPSKRFDLARRTIGAVFFSVGIATILTFDVTDLSNTKGIDDDLSWHVIDENSPEKIFEQFLAEAKTHNQPVMIDFYADWCVACKQLDVATFREKNVKTLLKNFYLIRIDSTQSSKSLLQLQNRFKVTGLPTVVFIKKDGIIVDQRILGYLPPEQFIETLRHVLL